MAKQAFINVTYESLVTPPLAIGAWIRKDFPGFDRDYLAIHCLIRKYQPKTFLEIGTSTGLGTKVICTAIGIRKAHWWNLFGSHDVSTPKVFSIDVPPGTDPTIIYPAKEDGHPDKTGKYCKFPFTQLFGDSQTFNFKPYYPLDGWFIDGKHNFEFASKDTRQALKAKAKIIIWHDMQIEDVARAVEIVMRKQKRYSCYRVAQTRIAFAVRKIS